jgi:ribosomal protein L12E/L44/L45/RPP1/RPP2
VPAGAANATVQVGTQTSSAATFAIVPTLTSVNTVDTFMSKPALIRGATITLTGTNFDPVAANNSVMFGATAAVPTAATATQLTVTVPGVLGVAGDVLISAVTNTQSSNSITAVVPAVNVQINNSGFH